MPSIPEHAQRGIAPFVEHIQNRGSDGTRSYKEFATLIGAFDKNGNPAPRFMGAVLGKIGGEIERLCKGDESVRQILGDEEPPRITVLVVNKNSGLPSTGLEQFIKGWDNLNDAGKKSRVNEEKERMDRLRERGLFVALLDSLRHDRNNALEFDGGPPKHGSDYSVAEGITLKTHREVEYQARNQSIVKEKKARSDYSCEACGFQFAEKYGSELGAEYIECHHLKPLSQSKGGEQTGLDDLALLCANCHRMIHKLLRDNQDKYRKDYRQSLRDLRDAVKRNRGG